VYAFNEFVNKYKLDSLEAVLNIQRELPNFVKKCIEERYKDMGYKGNGHMLYTYLPLFSHFLELRLTQLKEK